MVEYSKFLSEWLCEGINSFTNLITYKSPFISVLFPVSGFGSLYIPDNIAIMQTSNGVLDFIATATPYLKFIFLLLTILLTVISFILQMRKMSNNNKKDERD